VWVLERKFEVLKLEVLVGKCRFCRMLSDHHCLRVGCHRRVGEDWLQKKDCNRQEASRGSSPRSPWPPPFTPAVSSTGLLGLQVGKGGTEGGSSGARGEWKKKRPFPRGLKWFFRVSSNRGFIRSLVRFLHIVRGRLIGCRHQGVLSSYIVQSSYSHSCIFNSWCGVQKKTGSRRRNVIKEDLGVEEQKTSLDS